MIADKIRREEDIKFVCQTGRIYRDIEVLILFCNKSLLKFLITGQVKKKNGLITNLIL